MAEDKVQKAQEQAKKETEKVDKKIEKANENAQKCEEKAKEAAKEGKGLLSKAWGYMKRIWTWIVNKLKAIKAFIVKIWRKIIGWFGKLVSVDSRIKKLKKALNEVKDNPKAKKQIYKQYKALIQKRKAIEEKIFDVDKEKQEKLGKEWKKIEAALEEAREKFKEFKKAAAKAKK